MENKPNENGLETLAKLWDQLTPTQQQLMLRRAEAMAARNKMAKPADADSIPSAGDNH
ncbi:MAG: hypothetical protein IKQ91_01785 [Oscillospiraceae bacterium]|nr:hypothetical protein [Oscillospiraceae bacterium]MBR3448394.1 hypothetical protein [Oscillospiraceae bacterium]MBR4199993.1 hypothetical protein [Oscillospiraceae bacterium]